MKMDVKQTVRHKTRKQERKEDRKLKKMRRDCFNRQKPLPTRESLEAEKLECQKQQMIKRQKLKEKMQKKEERREKERATKNAEEDKKRQLEIINRGDQKTLRELERKLKIKPKLNTWPAAFSNDNLDYILNYKDEAELLKSYVESGKDKKSKSRKRLHSSDEDEPLESGEENLSLNLGNNEDDDDDKDSDDEKEEMNDGSDLEGSDEESEMELGEEDEVEDDEHDETEEEGEEVSEGDENSSEDDEDAGGKMQKCKLASKKDADVKGILKDLKSKDKTEKKLVRFGEKSKAEEPKKPSNALTEDIYGRLRDKQGNVVKDSNAFVPPGRRLQQQQQQQGDSEGLETLKVQISRIINRLHDKQMQMFSSQMENLFISHSRSDVSEVLMNELIKVSIKNEPIKRNRALDSMLLLAILHTKVGNEVSAVFLESLVAKFDQIFQTLDDSDGAETENQMENAVLLLAHLYQFKVIDCHLVYSIIEKLVSRFFVKDIHLLTLVWKEIGFGLRKDNPKIFQNIYLKTTEQVSTVDKKYAHKRVLSMQLSEILLAVKTNIPKKLPIDDEEELESRQKLLKTILSDSVNAPLHVSLDDLLSTEQKGKWWLVGSAWAGNTGNTLKRDVDEQKSESVPHVGGVNLVKLAQKLHMNTDVRKKILFAIVTSNNYCEAFERVMKLNLTRQQDKDIIHVVSILCKRGKGNPFYTHLAEAFRRHHKRFKKLPGISEDHAAEKEMDFD